jgi:hypothetical protein
LQKPFTSGAIDHLPEKYQIVIFLRELEELGISDVAARLGSTIPAVKTRHRRARQKVAGFLERSRTLSAGVARTDYRCRAPQLLSATEPLFSTS